VTRLRPLHYAVITLLTETQIIETYAAQYLSLAGAPAKRTDCRAKPGTNSATRMARGTPSLDARRPEI